jgi:hypothetical protein
MPPLTSIPLVIFAASAGLTRVMKLAPFVPVAGGSGCSGGFGSPAMFSISFWSMCTVPSESTCVTLVFAANALIVWPCGSTAPPVRTMPFTICEASPGVASLNVVSPTAPVAERFRTTGAIPERSAMFRTLSVTTPVVVSTPITIASRPTALLVPPAFCTPPETRIPSDTFAASAGESVIVVVSANPDASRVCAAVVP